MTIKKRLEKLEEKAHPAPKWVEVIHVSLEGTTTTWRPATPEDLIGEPITVEIGKVTNDDK